MAKTVYRRFMAIMFAVLIVVMALWFLTRYVPEDSIPSFAGYYDVIERKDAFIKFFENKSRIINNAIALKRQKLLLLYDKEASTNNITTAEIEWLKLLAQEYEVDNFNIDDKNKRKELSLRVDEVPSSMLIAQAAIESAWGTSRFAKEGNNFFGMWCYDMGCGMVPKRRDSDKNHEVKKYNDVETAITDFIHTLNTNASYKAFRKLRLNQRISGLKLSGYSLIAQLKSYSQMGKKYIKIVRKVIKDNNLE